MLPDAFSHTCANIFLGYQETELQSKRIYAFQIITGIFKLPSNLVIPMNMYYNAKFPYSIPTVINHFKFS